MLTQFLTVEVALAQSPSNLQQVIEAELKTYGNPLRWAVTAVNITTQRVIVEAIVTRKDEG